MAGNRGTSTFVAETTVAAALVLHPRARWVLAAYHVGPCGGCPAAADETLAEVAAAYRFPLADLLRDLNAVLER